MSIDKVPRIPQRIKTFKEQFKAHAQEEFSIGINKIVGVACGTDFPLLSVKKLIGLVWSHSGWRYNVGTKSPNGFKIEFKLLQKSCCLSQNYSEWDICHLQLHFPVPSKLMEKSMDQTIVSWLILFVADDWETHMRSMSSFSSILAHQSRTFRKRPWMHSIIIRDWLKRRDCRLCFYSWYIFVDWKCNLLSTATMQFSHFKGSVPILTYFLRLDYKISS